MKKVWSVLFAMLLFLVSVTTLAQHHRHGRHYHGPYYSPLAAIVLGVPGIYYGVPNYEVYYPPYAPYYPPIIYRPPVVMVPPPVYVQPPHNTDWFYCAGRGYYPYVQECSTGWQRVPAQPPR